MSATVGRRDCPPPLVVPWHHCLRRVFVVMVAIAAAGILAQKGLGRHSPLGLFSHSVAALNEPATNKKLPQCYSTPEADPSYGAWWQSGGGVKDSPADMVKWTWDSAEFRYYKRRAKRGG